MKIEAFEAILHTGGRNPEDLRAEYGNVTDEEIQGYLKVFSAMDGQRAIVTPDSFSDGEYVYCGLFDNPQAKEVAYLMEQDPFMGCYIDQRETFDRAWDSGQYCPDGCWTLKSKYVEIVGPLEKQEPAQAGEGGQRKTASKGGISHGVASPTEPSPLSS